jgi:hypothetical protein
LDILFARIILLGFIHQGIVAAQTFGEPTLNYQVQNLGLILLLPRDSEWFHGSRLSLLLQKDAMEWNSNLFPIELTSNSLEGDSNFHDALSSSTLRSCSVGIGCQLLDY